MRIVENSKYFSTKKVIKEMDILMSFFPMCYFYRCFEQFQLEMYIYLTASTDIYQDYSYSYTIRPIFVYTSHSDLS